MTQQLRWVSCNNTQIEGGISAALGTEDWQLVAEFEPTTILAHNPKDQFETLNIERYVLLRGEKTPVASFELHPMIGCCAIAVSTRALVGKDYRGKGLGTLLNKLRIQFARERGYGALLCTDVAQNLPQRRIMKRNDWKDIFKFINPRTKNEIFIDVVKL